MLRPGFILLAVFAVGSFTAECPAFDTVANLNLAQHAGVWQVHGMIRTAGLLPTIDCLQQEVTGENFEVEPVNLGIHLMGTYTDSGDMLHEEGSAVVEDLGLPGYWTVNYNKTESLGHIIFSDYVDFSLFARCESNGDVEAWIMSRYHDPIPETIANNFKGLLADYGVDVKNYASIYHDHMICGHH